MNLDLFIQFYTLVMYIFNVIIIFIKNLYI
jgi:hypothetical protein